VHDDGEMRARSTLGRSAASSFAMRLSPLGAAIDTAARSF
jgi:hypothetical protein